MMIWFLEAGIGLVGGRATGEVLARARPNHGLNFTNSGVAAMLRAMVSSNSW